MAKRVRFTAYVFKAIQNISQRLSGEAQPEPIRKLWPVNDGCLSQQGTAVACVAGQGLDVGECQR